MTKQFSEHEHLRAQATLEFALLLPILFSLLYWIIYSFRVNHQTSGQATLFHAEVLKKFDHGRNQNPIVIDGIEMVPGRYSEVIPAGAPFDLGNLVQTLGPQLGLQWGLNALFNRVSWLSGDTYLSGAMRGGIQNAAQSWAASGFKEVDWDSVKWGAATGALSSSAAQEDFANFGDVAGDVAHNSALSYTRAEGDLSAIPAGAVSGYFASDQFHQWGSGHEVWSAAARGAVSSAAAGVFSGNLEMRDVLVGAGAGLVSTTALAGGIRSFGSGSVQQLASIAATSAALSNVLNGGNRDQAFSSAMDAATSSSAVNTMARSSQPSNPNPSSGSTRSSLSEAHAVSMSVVRSMTTTPGESQTDMAMTRMLEGSHTEKDLIARFGDPKSQQQYLQDAKHDTGNYIEVAARATASVIAMEKEERKDL